MIEVKVKKIRKYIDDPLFNVNKPHYFIGAFVKNKLYSYVYKFPSSYEASKIIKSRRKGYWCSWAYIPKNKYYIQNQFILVYNSYEKCRSAFRCVKHYHDKLNARFNNVIEKDLPTMSMCKIVP